MPGTKAAVLMALVYHPGVDYSALVAGAYFQILKGLHVVRTGVVTGEPAVATG